MHRLTFATGGYQPLLPQSRQLLAHCRLPRPQNGLKLGHRSLVICQVAEDHQAPLIAQSLQEGRRLDDAIRNFVRGLLP